MCFHHISLQFFVLYNQDILDLLKHDYHPKKRRKKNNIITIRPKLKKKFCLK